MILGAAKQTDLPFLLLSFSFPFAFTNGRRGEGFFGTFPTYTHTRARTHTLGERARETNDELETTKTLRPLKSTDRSYSFRKMWKPRGDDFTGI